MERKENIDFGCEEMGYFLDFHVADVDDFGSQSLGGFIFVECGIDGGKVSLSNDSTVIYDVVVDIFLWHRLGGWIEVGSGGIWACLSNFIHSFRNKYRE